MGAFGGWLRPPRLRSGADGETDRHATWLELFFDLVFVVAVAQLAYVLAGDVTPTGALRFVALFVPVWWAWIGSTFYATRFDTDDVEYRLLTAVEMFGVVALAVNIPDGFGASSSGFALAYAGIRGVLVFKYYRAVRHVPEARPLTTRFARGFGLAALVWFVSAFVPPPFRFLLWALGLAIDFGTPITAGTLHAELPPHPSHLPERFGLFTIIVLGEAIIGVVSGIAAQEWTAASVLVGAFGTAIAFCLWWIYFDDHDGSAVRAAQAEGRIWTYQAWLYLHLPLVVGLTAAGVGVLRVLTGDLSTPLPAAERWLLCGSLALCLVAMGLLHRTTLACAGRRAARRNGVASRFGTGALIVAVAAVGAELPAVVLVGLLAIACAAQVGVDLRARGPDSFPSEAD
ncbi:low temperature requirement protein A [Halegenticoccus tardaugens]|uniref:low temperature requirement protein A n=1 Tax=Halegenticoccus tardaugens TaxID=2071624 RepID=UPI0013E97BB2|nr:low temperature requirement protein A [Halegenticoccus tardaugens]